MMLDGAPMPSCLVVAAHPDDAEIGCAGLILALKSKGWNITVVIVSYGEDLEEKKRTRGLEAERGLETLGVDRDDIVHLDMPANTIEITGSLVDRIRKLAENVELVATHSPNDNHQDHYNTYRLVCAAVRHATILRMNVPTSTRQSEFHGVYFVDVTGNAGDLKYRALACHQSQLTSRVSMQLVCDTDKTEGRHIGLERAESFEVQLPPRARAWPTMLSLSNASPVHSFWSELAADGNLVLITQGIEKPDIRAFYDASADVFAATSELRSFLERSIFPSGPIATLSHSDPRVLEAEACRNCVYIGGRFANQASRRYARDVSRNLWYRIVRPKGSKSSILYDATGHTITSVVSRNSKVDYAIVTLTPPGKIRAGYSLWFGGLHAPGSTGAIRAFLDPHFMSQILAARQTCGFQALVRVDVMPERVQAALVDVRPLRWRLQG